MRGCVANLLVVLLLFFLGQDLHLCAMSVERREMGKIGVLVVVVVVELEVSGREESFV
jgi:hypothetical protein